MLEKKKCLLYIHFYLLALCTRRIIVRFSIFFSFLRIYSKNIYVLYIFIYIYTQRSDTFPNDKSAKRPEVVQKLQHCNRRSLCHFRSDMLLVSEHRFTHLYKFYSVITNFLTIPNCLKKVICPKTWRKVFLRTNILMIFYRWNLSKWWCASVHRIGHTICKNLLTTTELFLVIHSYVNIVRKLVISVSSCLYTNFEDIVYV